MSNPETHTCPTCGYVWLHGRDGSHNCDVLLLDRIENLESELNRAQSNVKRQGIMLSKAMGEFIELTDELKEANTRIEELDSELQGARRVISQIPDTL